MSEFDSRIRKAYLPPYIAIRSAFTAGPNPPLCCTLTSHVHSTDARSASRPTFADRVTRRSNPALREHVDQVPGPNYVIQPRPCLYSGRAAAAGRARAGPPPRRRRKRRSVAASTVCRLRAQRGVGHGDTDADSVNCSPRPRWGDEMGRPAGRTIAVAPAGAGAGRSACPHPKPQPVLRPFRADEARELHAGPWRSGSVPEW